ncbi:heme-binding protein [Natronomonas sp. F2-12]|jgi:chlorite dismutase|uniref:Heme-binding protein n=1 Tax=Natronomonas aquatica TaxID=2841590 RepID=A0A9R1CPV5_9EURY|nr:heme-binding protein [Natronomonas aquatica]MCQ4332828.1 heme-binding protein [Natronomonas aquatica]
MQQRRPPGTEEGWYALHDLRRIDWDAWRDATERERERALEEGIEYLRAHVEVTDSEEGGSAAFTVVGHKADLMVLHLRPTLEDLDRAERRFESTALAEFTERASSYVSVTEVSGYMHEELADGIEDIEDAGMRNYMKQRIYPEIPDAEHVCFYPMDKRRDPEYNWYDLPFEERSELMSAHGDIGREYAGKVSQIISGSVGLDDHEWGVTLFADDPTDIKHLLYEMRFDPSSSKFAEFGTFYVGRRFPPADLPAVFAGETVPTEGPDTGTGESGTDRAEDERHPGGTDEGSGSGSGSGGRPDTGGPDHEEIDAGTLSARLGQFGVDLEEYPEAGYGLLFRSDADAEELNEAVEGLRGNFDHYDTHVLTAVRADSGETAVVSLWRNERAANTASGFLADLPGVGSGTGAAFETDSADSADSTDTETHGTDEDGDIRGQLEDLDIYAGTPHGEDVYALVLYSEADPDRLRSELSDLGERFDHYDTHVKSAVYADEHGGGRSAIVSIWETKDAADTAGGYLSELPGIVARAGEESGFGTMGMFYTVKPAHREDFVETFGEVGGILEEMDGHLETALMTNETDENDMFIASQWRDREDAMEFFRSEAFRETVEWGREVLADRPRHVFLA